MKNIIIENSAPNSKQSFFKSSSDKMIPYTSKKTAKKTLIQNFIQIFYKVFNKILNKLPLNLSFHFIFRFFRNAFQKCKINIFIFGFKIKTTHTLILSSAAILSILTAMSFLSSQQLTKKQTIIQENRFFTLQAAQNIENANDRLLHLENNYATTGLIRFKREYEREWLLAQTTHDHTLKMLLSFENDKKNPSVYDYQLSFDKIKIIFNRLSEIQKRVILLADKGDLERAGFLAFSQEYFQIEYDAQQQIRQELTLIQQYQDERVSKFNSEVLFANKLHFIILITDVIFAALALILFYQKRLIQPISSLKEKLTYLFPYKNFNKKNNSNGLNDFLEIQQLIQCVHQYENMADKLKFAKTYLQDISYALPFGIYQLETYPDGTDRYTFISKRAAFLLSVSQDELIRNSQSRRRYMNTEDIESSHEKVRHALDRITSGEECAIVDSMIRLNVDSHIRILRYYSFTRAIDLKPDGTVLWSGYFEDITDQFDDEFDEN